MSTHVDDTTWERLAMKELSPAERTTALEHVLTCDRCRTIYRGLTALESGAREAGLHVPARVATRSRWWMGAGAAVAAAAVLLLWWRWPAPAGDTLRGGEHPVELITPAGDPRAPGALAWQAIDGATRYRVEVFTGAGTLVWQRELAGLSATWPDDAPRTAGAYRWRVVALGPAGELARSRLAPLVLAP